MEKDNTKVVRTLYVEKFFNRNEFDGSGGFEVYKVDSRDPLMIPEEKNLIGFRFFEVEEMTVDGNHKISLEPMKNYSGMYYFGERVTYKDLIGVADTDFLKRLQLDYLNRFEVEEAIFCENAGRVISCIAPEDKTIDEAKIERINEEANTIFINQKHFLEGVATLLEANHNNVDIVMSDVLSPIADCLTGEAVDDMGDVIRTYDVYINGYKSISSLGIVGDNRLGLYDRDTYFRLDTAETLIGSLYQEFPYLEGAMHDLKLALASDRDIDVSKALVGSKKSK